GRQDLVGNGCDCLSPAQPPKEAIEARRRRANDPDHYHTVANPTKGEKPGERGLPNKGYRPGRKMARRQDKKPKRKGAVGPSDRNPSAVTLRHGSDGTRRRGSVSTRA